MSNIDQEIGFLQGQSKAFEARLAEFKNEIREMRDDITSHIKDGFNEIKSILNQKADEEAVKELTKRLIVLELAQANTKTWISNFDFKKKAVFSIVVFIATIIANGIWDVAIDLIKKAFNIL